MKYLLLRLSYKILNHYINKSLGRNLSDAQYNNYVFQHMRALQDILVHLGGIK